MTIRYVQPNGTGTNCSESANPSTPWNQLSDILHTSNPCGLTGGDIVEIRANTAGGEAVFEERFDAGLNPSTQIIPGGTDWNSPLTIRGRAGDRIIIKPSGAGAIFGFEDSSQHHIILENLVIDGINTSLPQAGAVWVEETAKHIRLLNCTIRNAKGNGAGGSLHTSGGSEDIQILNCLLEYNGTDVQFLHGIYLGAPNSLIEGCIVRNSSSVGLHIFNQHVGFEEAGVANIKMRRNLIVNNGGRGILAGGDEDSVIENNIIAGNGYVGVPTVFGYGVHLSYSGGYKGTFVNNTLYNNREQGLNLNSDCFGVVVKNNIFYLNNTYGSDGGAEITNAGVSTVFGTNLAGETGTGIAIVGNPLFKDAANLDFHLALNSPAVNVGEVLAAIVDDFNGFKRDLTRNDIGALRVLYPRMLGR